MKVICAVFCLTGLLSADTLTDRVDAVFKRWSEPDSPGCALAVIKDNRIIYQHGYGMADLEHDVPIKPQTVFYIGSTSKQFTAFSLLLLASQHKLSLDDNVRKYIPELPDYGTPITLREMLHHTSGLRDYNTLLYLGGRRSEDAFANRDVLDIAVRQKSLNFTPGTEFLYSNTGYVLLAIVIERVSGIPLSQFAAKNIFEPLEMTHTHIHDDLSRIVKDRALPYERDPSGVSFDTPAVARSGAGGVLTTLADLRAWDQNFYDSRVGGADLIEQMQERGTLRDGKQLEYASGLHVHSVNGMRIVDHDGALGGYRASLTRFPDQHLSVACLCNQGDIDSGKLALQVAGIYLGGTISEPPAPTQAPSGKKDFPDLGDLHRFEGDFYNDELNVTYALRTEANKLKVSIRGVPFQEWSPSAPDRFSGSGSEVQFDHSQFRLTSGRVKDLLFVKVVP
jgi:CubicO group peptidase (beta-lactamase class C family)